MINLGMSLVMDRLVLVLAALASLVAAVILLIDHRFADAQVTAILFVGLTLAIDRIRA